MNSISLNSLKYFFSNLWKQLDQLTINPWFAYLSILILQLRRVWNAWQYRDLTFGDTSYHFVFAHSWSENFTFSYVWSPLYSIYYGTIYKIIPDVPIATLIHRLLLVFLLAILVLAVMRKLLPYHIAWLISAWWVVLPINFNSLYEIHLFSILLPLASVWIVFLSPIRWIRGIVLGILLTSALLIRNEVIIAFGLWLLICLIWEIRNLPENQKRPKQEHVVQYGFPIIVAMLIFVFSYVRTIPKPSAEFIAKKHTLNVCQIYAFGYQQRYSDWSKSPWLDCHELMQRDFGEPLPSMVKALQTNHQAMLEHFLWNLKLLPAGIQVALFNATSESINPDYAPVDLNVSIILLPSVIYLVVFFVALVKLIKERQLWWSFWLHSRVWGWLLLFCLSTVMVIVIPMQRPRPSYMFLFTLTLMAIIGMSLFVLTKRDRVSFYFSRLISILLVVSVLFAPSYFQAQQRPLLSFYKRLLPSQEVIGISGTEIVVIGYSQELCNYFTKTGQNSCIGKTYAMFDSLQNGIPMNEIIEQEPFPVVLIYIDQNFMTNYGENESVVDFLSNPEEYGWRMIMNNSVNPTQAWSVYINEVELENIKP